MAESQSFEWVSAELERRTSFSQLQARGTVRLALRKAGAEPHSVTRPEMLVVLETFMPRELKARNIENGQKVCDALIAGLRAANLKDPTAPAGPEDTLRRMFGG